MAITEQHFQLLTSAQKQPVRRGSALGASSICGVSWLAAAVTVGAIGGTTGWLVGGAVLLALPATWLTYQVRHTDA